MVIKLKPLFLGCLLGATAVSITIILFLTLHNSYPIKTGQDAQPTTTPLILPATPTPIISGQSPIYVGTPSTATPRFDEVRPEPEYTVTPTPMSVTDLAEGVPDENKIIYVVKRADGRYEQFILSLEMDDYAEQSMQLGPQDVIVGVQPVIPLPPATPNIEKEKTPPVFVLP